MKKIKVHIADDHQILLDGLTAVLSNESNIEVVGSSLNGRSVINWFNENKADILILDINMPEVDGIEVLQYFVERKMQHKTIVLSSYDDIKLIKEVLKIGASGFLAKKCAGENIVEAVNKVFNNQQYFSETIQNKLLKSLTENLVKNETLSPDGTFFSPLTQREQEVIKLIAQEYSTKEIAKKLHISVNTVETHRKNLISKLNVKNVVGLAIYAYRNNII